MGEQRSVMEGQKVGDGRAKVGDERAKVGDGRAKVSDGRAKVSDGKGGRERELLDICINLVSLFQEDTLHISLCLSQYFVIKFCHQKIHPPKFLLPIHTIYYGIK